MPMTLKCAREFFLVKVGSCSALTNSAQQSKVMHKETQFPLIIDKELAEVGTRKKFPAVGEACMAIF